MIAFNHVVPVLNLSVFNVRRAPAFAFEQSKRATIGGRFIRVDESRDLPLLHVVEDFTQKPVCSFAVTTGGEIKMESVWRSEIIVRLAIYLPSEPVRD